MKNLSYSTRRHFSCMKSGIKLISLSGKGKRFPNDRKVRVGSPPTFPHVIQASGSRTGKTCILPTFGAWPFGRPHHKTFSYSIQHDRITEYFIKNRSNKIHGRGTLSWLRRLKIGKSVQKRKIMYSKTLVFKAFSEIYQFNAGKSLQISSYRSGKSFSIGKTMWARNPLIRL